MEMPWNIDCGCAACAIGKQGEEASLADPARTEREELRARLSRYEELERVVRDHPHDRFDNSDDCAICDALRALAMPEQSKNEGETK